MEGLCRGRPRSEHAATVLPSPQASEDRTAYGDAEVALKALRELGISFLFRERSEDQLQGPPSGRGGQSWSPAFWA